MGFNGTTPLFECQEDVWALKTSTPTDFEHLHGTGLWWLWKSKAAKGGSWSSSSSSQLILVMYVCV